VLQLTSWGIPVIYYGEEVARAGGKWPDNRSDMPWGSRDILPGKGAPRDEGLRRDYQKLIAIRKAHPALSHGSHLGLSAEGDLYVFVRRDGSDAVIVAVNRGNALASAKVAAPAEWGEAAAVDLLDGSAVSREGGSLSLTVGPRQARIVGTH
jgi:alpha-amylase